MKVLVIAANNLRRLVRERSNLFFVFVLPLMLILVLGLTLGSNTPRVGIHVDAEESAGVRELIDGLEDLEEIEVTVFDSLDEATGELEREDITALLVVHAGYDDDLAAGETTEIEYRVIPTGGGFEVQSLVQAVLADLNTTLRAGRFVGEWTGMPASEARERVAAAEETLGGVDVATVDPDGENYVDADAVGFVAAQELVLFVFLIAMVAASALIQARRLGVTQRMLATPTTTFQIVAGETLGRYAVAIVQAAFIVGATALLFGLDWGSWPATTAIVATFALVATAGALFVGALVTNESQSTAVGMPLGLALAALGGCMVPFEVFPDWLDTLAHVTPHAWAVDAFTEVIQRGGGLGQIGLELAVLTLYGLVLLVGASFALRRAIIG